METESIKKWKEYIVLRGIDRTANDLRVSREIVRLWAKKSNVPAGANLRRFVAMAKAEMGLVEFAEFISSLSRDIFGSDLGPGQDRAVNE